MASRADGCLKASIVITRPWLAVWRLLRDRSFEKLFPKIKLLGKGWLQARSMADEGAHSWASDTTPTLELLVQAIMKAKASSQSKCMILVVKEEKYSCCFHYLHISLTHSAKNEGKGRMNTLTTIWAYTSQSRSLLVFSLNPVLVNFAIFNFAHTVQRKCGGMVSKYFMVVQSCILKWSLLKILLCAFV